MLRSFSLVLTLVVGMSASFSQHSAERRFASRVSQESLRTNVRSLVRLGNRWGGTSSGDKAAEFVASRLRRYGLEVEVIEDPPRLVYDHSDWILKVASPTRLRRLFRHEWLAGYSPSVPVSGGTLVDLESDPPASELTGVVVLTERFVPGDLYDDLVAQGVAAILSFAPADSDSYSDWSLITHLNAVEDNPIPLYNISFRNGLRLRKELAGGTEIRIEFSATTKMGPGSPKTVIGTMKGSSDTSRIICAHGDSDAGGPGADDNASGVAGVLELAGTFSRMVTEGILPAPRESIKFIVWGSEYYSTEHFVKGLSEDIHKIASVINFDEIGFGSARNCVYFESNDIPHNEDLLHILNAVGEDYAGKRGFWQEATTNPSQG
ncbi:MAG TPA: M28 family peptidase, partial [Bacteroidota bacterium]